MTAPKFRSVESLITDISQLRPWWCWYNPWGYAMLVEGYLRQALIALQEERETVVKVRHKR